MAYTISNRYIPRQAATSLENVPAYVSQEWRSSWLSELPMILGKRLGIFFFGGSAAATDLLKIPINMMKAEILPKIREHFFLVKSIRLLHEHIGNIYLHSSRLQAFSWCISSLLSQVLSRTGKKRKVRPSKSEMRCGI